MGIDAEQVAQLVGDPRLLERNLVEFRESAQLLSSEHVKLIDHYAQQWVAIYRSEVEASSPSLHNVIAKIDKKRLPREDVIIRFIDRNPRTLIL